jgi:hypothetical protein
MCNLYTYELARDEIRGLLHHYRLVASTLEETLKLQKPRADEEIVITPYDEKKTA